MSLSKKHYKAIAEILKSKRLELNKTFNPMTSEQLLNSLENDLTNYFGSDNIRFDAERFKEACNN